MQFDDFRLRHKDSVHGARPFIYKGLHRALNSVAKRLVKSFISKSLQIVYFLSTFEPKKYKRVFLTAVSMSTL